MNELGRLRHLFKDQIQWYKERIVLVNHEDLGLCIDNSYIYDCIYDKFMSLSNGDMVEILEILSKED